MLNPDLALTLETPNFEAAVFSNSALMACSSSEFSA